MLCWCLSAGLVATDVSEVGSQVDNKVIIQLPYQLGLIVNIYCTSIVIKVRFSFLMQIQDDQIRLSKVKQTHNIKEAERRERRPEVDRLNGR